MNLKNLLRTSGDLPGAAVAHRAALALPPRAGRSTTTWHVLWRRPATRRPKSTFNLLSIFRHKRRPSITGLRMRPPLGAILRSHSSSTNPHWRWSRNAAGHRLHWAERRWLGTTRASAARIRRRLRQDLHRHPIALRTRQRAMEPQAP